MIICDYITSLRPSGERIIDFFFMSLDVANHTLVILVLILTFLTEKVERLILFRGGLENQKSKDLKIVDFFDFLGKLPRNKTIRPPLMK